MQLLITGADRPLGKATAERLCATHELRLTGIAPGPSSVDWDYQQADLRSAEQVAGLVPGVDVVLHLAEFEPTVGGYEGEEQERLERATLGTHMLCQEARKAGVERIVVASTLKVFDAHPERFQINEMWKPRPAPTVEHLAPYLCEQVVREFAREGDINGLCLRFLPVGDDPERNTSLGDALHALECAMALQFTSPGRHWRVFHIASSPRYPVWEAIRRLGFKPEGER